MKTFNKKSLPEIIEYKGKIYKCDFKSSAAIIGKKVFSLTELGLNDKNVVAVNVLKKKPYELTCWLFVN